VLIDEWFNANPTSMRAAIAALAATPGRRVAILGDMLELGATSPELHRGLAEPLIQADARIVHTVGTMITHLRDALPETMRGRHAATSADFAADLPAVEPGDVVLVKGSKGIALGKVVAAIETTFGGARA
jgi:UDP-N-acetylmuramoyl-tripeptide--D-alanyl-D-alanine ligase